MSDDTEEIQKLLRLKRYEMPPEGFFEDFLKEFQNRQRSELMRRSARSIFFERLSTYFSGYGTPKWVGAAAGACAVTIIAIVVAGGGFSDSNSPAPDNTIARSNSASLDQVTRMGSRLQSVAPVSLLFIEDLHPTPTNHSFDHRLVEAEGPFSDLYILHNPVFAPNINSGLSVDF